MGFCSSKEPLSPVIMEKISRDDLSDLIYLKLQPRQIYIIDDDYGLCSINDYNIFFQSEEITALNHLKGAMTLGNIDNFCLILLGRQKEWFSRTCSYLGSAFGYLIGELDERTRMFNFLIDKNQTLWLVDPIDKRIYAPPRNLQVNFVSI